MLTWACLLSSSLQEPLLSLEPFKALSDFSNFGCSPSGCMNLCVFALYIHTHISKFGKYYLFFMICNRVIKYMGLHKKCSIELGERGVEVLEVDASAGIRDILGTLWDGRWLQEHQEPVEYLGLEGTICAK